VKSTEVVRSLSALAHESRLAVFRILVKRGPEGFTPGDLSAQLDVPAPTLSFHLKELQSADLVLVRRESRFLFYRANYERIDELLSYLTDQCCAHADGPSDDRCGSLTVPRKQRV
jgi:ArsR family transcriptional regulator, arsenate/arsenite/antimonite-responsive transcriptional repressor